MQIRYACLFVEIEIRVADLEGFLDEPAVGCGREDCRSD
jgi:hypothetical protein